MSLSYCHRHKRLWSFIQLSWVSFPKEKIDEISEYYDRLYAAHTDPSSLNSLSRAAFTIVETCCDVCTTVARQAVDAYIAPPQ